MYLFEAVLEIMDYSIELTWPKEISLHKTTITSGIYADYKKSTIFENTYDKNRSVHYLGYNLSILK